LGDRISAFASSPAVLREEPERYSAGWSRSKPSNAHSSLAENSSQSCSYIDFHWNEKVTDFVLHEYIGTAQYLSITRWAVSPIKTFPFNRAGVGSGNQLTVQPAIVPAPVENAQRAPQKSA
jgi:hypothetical protein